ncbi:MAG: META domain-containing protein [Pseudomonadota bacterium]
MTLRFAAFVAVSGLSACSGDETLTAYGASDIVWALAELDGVPYTAEAELEFPGPGRFVGRTPCNQFSGQVSAPYPWFAVRALTTTDKTCQDQTEEDMFLKSLNAASLAEVAGDTLVLSTPEGPKMVFKSRE